jgi:hypothetical protein
MRAAQFAIRMRKVLCLLEPQPGDLLLVEVMDVILNHENNMLEPAEAVIAWLNDVILQATRIGVQIALQRLYARHKVEPPPVPNLKSIAQFLTSMLYRHPETNAKWAALEGKNQRLGWEARENIVGVLIRCLESGGQLEQGLHDKESVESLKQLFQGLVFHTRPR